MIYDKKIKSPVFSGHETFPLRYGWLKKVYDEMKVANSNEQDAKDVFNKDEAIAIFGVGKNMVSSMRHWANYTKIIQDNKLTDFAKEIFDDGGLDPYIECPSTLWLLHWHIATSENLVTYYWFFNYYNGGAFDRKQLNEEIMSLCNDMNWKTPSASTLKRDVECFVRMYAGKDVSTKAHDDDSIESPLSELALIQPTKTNGYYSVSRGNRSTLSAPLFLYAVCQFWLNEKPNNSSLSLEALMYDPCSPGRIFLLDEDALINLSHQVSESNSDHILWTETAGLKQFTLKPNADIAKLKNIAWEKLVREYTS